MWPGGMSAHTEPLVPLLKRMLDAVERLVGNHLTLARMELGEDARGLGRRVLEIAMFVPVAIIGLGLVGASAAIFLGSVIGPGWGFLAVGGLFLAAGAGGVLYMKNRASRAEPVLNDTGDEIKKSAAAIGDAADGDAPPMLAHTER